MRNLFASVAAAAMMTMVATAAIAQDADE